MDDEKPRQESNYELERRLRRERARQDYLDRHPFHKDKIDIKPMIVIIELTQKYFEDNPNSDEFQLEKAILGSKLGIGSTKTLSVCNALAGEYEFIDDGRGSITIDRKGFQNWIKLREELEKEKERNLNQHKEAQFLIEEIKKYQEGNEGNEKILADMRSRKEGLEKSIAKIEGEQKGLPEQIKALEEKKAKVRAEADKLQAEISKAAKEYQDEQKKIDDETKAKEQNKMWIFRRPIIPSFEYDDSPARKLSKEILRFLLYGFIFHIIWYLLYFNNLN